MDFSKHFRMSESDAITYAREKLDFFSPDDDLDCKEIGDGNVNYVFRVFSKNSDRSIIIKQADINTRISYSQLNTDRARIEAELLQIEEKYTGEMVPKFYLFDPIMTCFVMEDLTGHEIMRYAVMREDSFPGFAEKIATFMAETLINTTDFVLAPAEKKEMVKHFVNPDMCEISERLVYTLPYIEPVEKGGVADGSIDYVNNDLQKDEHLKSEVGKLKLDFMNNAQALIHGDLHTGSIFIKPDSMKVIDPEFAFFGPIGYDTGNVIANLMFAWVRALVSPIEDAEKHAKFLAWIEETVKETVDLFKQKSQKILTEKTIDPLFSLPELQSWYIDSLIADTAGVAGLEINRRIIGMAKVKDVTTIEDQSKRARAERILMETARHLIVERLNYKTGSDFVDTVKKFEAEIGSNF
jgi:5-methylthioribose kinase